MKNTPENLVKQEIKNYLDLYNWFHFHIRQGLGSYPGTPDRIAMKNGIVLFIEVKSKTGELSDKQKDFMRDTQCHGCHYIIARGYEDIESYIAGVSE